MLVNASSQAVWGLDHSRVKRLIECAADWNDQETLTRIQAILDSEGEQASWTPQKAVITHLHHVKKIVAHKRKAESIGSEEPPSARIRRSQVNPLLTGLLVSNA